MQVKELMRATEWQPPRSGTGPKPRVSVILPTFRRGKSGLFRMAARSVLGQSLKELELIVVDDGSTDGTAEQIQELIREDDRVGCLRHPRNVGLPAVSEYEAYCKARADWLAFAFDDDEFHPEALERLLEFALEGGHAIVHGYVEFEIKDPATDRTVTRRFDRGDTPQAALRGTNFISNNSVLLHRRVVETIGFYDPHVALARLCDWDLWRRAADAFPIVAADIPMGVVKGPSTSDSIGHTYPMELWQSHEWCELPRNGQLLPGRIESYDVLAAPPGLTRESARALEEVRQEFRSRFWFPREEPRSAAGGAGPEPEGRLLVVTSVHDACTTLYFDHLPLEWQRRVRIVYPRHYHPEEIVGASAVVFVRDLEYLEPWIERAEKLKVPRYYFLDDNFLVLARESDHRSVLDGYGVRAVRERLADFAGVLLSSPALVDYFAAEQLHPNLLLYPPIARRPLISDPAAFPAKRPGALRLAFFGGKHRIAAFAEYVAPAIEKLSRTMRLDVVAAGVPEGLLGLPSQVAVHTTPFEISYDLALARFAGAGVDVLCHPNSETANNPYKTLNVLISAWAMGAVPLVSNGPPFDEIRDGEVAVLCDDAPAAWEKGLLGVARDPQAKMRTAARLEAFCAERYGAKENAEALRRIFRAHPSPGLVLRDVRARQAMDLLRAESPSSESAPLPEGPPLVRAAGVLGADPSSAGGAVALRVAVDRPQWCGLEIETGREDPGHLVLRLLTDRGACLRETVSATRPRSSGRLVFQFAPLANSAGRDFRLELKPAPEEGSNGQGARFAPGTRHFFAASARIGCQLLFSA